MRGTSKRLAQQKTRKVPTTRAFFASMKFNKMKAMRLNCNYGDSNKKG